MTFALIGLLAVSLVGFLAVLDRRDKRSAQTLETTLGAHRLELVGLLERAEKERQAHREEVQVLCQRLQAPEVAVMQHQIDVAGPPEAVWPLTDEESANKQNVELLARIAELETEEAEATS